MSDPALPIPPPARKTDWDRVIGLSALAASVATVAFLAYQAYLMQVQAEASTWPYLQLSEVCCSEGLTIQAQNKGVGPAIIKLAVVKVDGKPQKTWAQTVKSLLGEDAPIAGTETLVRRVMDNGEIVRLLHIGDPDFAARVHAEFLKGRVTAAACYCSVLDKCWLAVPGQESVSAGHCPDVAPDRRFAQ